MKLSTLVKGIDARSITGSLNREIEGIAFDSRKCRSGFLFVAMKGLKADGHDYVEDAVQRGAVAVVSQKEIKVTKVPVIRVRNSRKALAQLAAKFYHYPAQKLKVIGVTGTNGKTTTSHMIASICGAHGLKTGIMGTLYIKIDGDFLPARITTPESLEIQYYLSEMVKAGCKVAVMEVSSHALYFERVAGIEFDGAVFTNLTQDHLDFHQDMEKYLEEKKKLFRMIKPKSHGGFALVNSDDPKTPEIVKILEAPYKSYGIYRHPQLRARKIENRIDGISFIAENEKWDVPVKMKMSGLFNVYNALAAVGAALYLDIPPAIIARGLANLQPVKGRFQIIERGQPFGVVVDYAHTPDGLNNLLLSAREVTANRLICVFGCGGDRDRTKRPVMGRIVGEMADVAIVTSDNPRTEDPRAIINDILPGVEKATRNYQVEVDRRKAIFKAVHSAESGDLVVIAGKGHEDYQILKDRTIHFDDSEIAVEALNELLTGSVNGKSSGGQPPL